MKPIKSLTARQTEILSFIEQQISEGLPPTQEEIRQHFDMKSRNSAQGFLETLENKGYIARERGKSRGIRVLIHTKTVVS